MSGLDITLAVIPLVVDGIKQCRAAYKFYKNTKRFGVDYNEIELRVRGQMARLNLLEQFVVQSLGQNNLRSEDTRIVQQTLDRMKIKFAECDSIQSKYRSPEDTQDTNPPSPDPLGISIPPIRIDGDQTPPDFIQQRKGKRRAWLSDHLIPTRPRSPRSRSRSSSASASHTSSPKTARSSHDFGESSSVSTAQTEMSLSLADFNRQESSKLKDRFAWADHDKEEMDRMIKELIEYNDTLESLFELNQALALNTQPPQQVSTEQLSSRLMLKAQRVERLHHQLRASNKSSQEVRFSLKLDYDEQAKRDVEASLDRSFEQDTHVHFLQASQKDDSAQDSQYIFVEQPGYNFRRSDRSLDPSSDISDVLTPEKPPIPDDPEAFWTKLGAVHKDDPLMVSRDSVQSWTKHSALSDALQNQAHKDQLRSVQLATLIAYSYSISTSLHGTVFPTTDDYAYYHPAHAQDQPQNQNSDYLLSPFLDFGLGSRPRHLSTSVSGIRSALQNPVVALGVLLHQVGVWDCCSDTDPLQESQQNSLKSQRRDAIRRLAALTRDMGVVYHDIVKKCLFWMRNVRSERGQDEVEARRVLEGVFDELLDCGVEIEEKVFG